MNLVTVDSELMVADLFHHDRLRELADQGERARRPCESSLHTAGGLLAE
jgi:hypothetical protein